MAAAGRLAAGVGADGEGAGQGEAGRGGELGGDPGERRLLGGAWFHATHRFRSAGLASVHSIFLWRASCPGGVMEQASPEVAAYIARWRPSSVSPQAAAFARDVVTQAGPEGRERAKNLLWAAGKLADYAASLGLELAPGVVLHPSVAERFTRCAPGLSGAARRTLRTNLRFIGRRVVPQPVSGGSAAAPGTVQGALQPGGDRRLSRAGGRAAHTERRMRAAGLVCLGAGAGLIRGDLRDARGTDVGAPVRRRGRHRARRPARARCRRWPATTPGCWPPRPVRRDRADLRRCRSRPPEHHEPAGHRTGRRGRAAPAGHLPAAGHVAGRLRRS